MEEKYYVEGVKVAYSNIPKAPYNPLKRPEIHYTRFWIALIGFIILMIAGGFAGRYLFSDSQRPVIFTVCLCFGMGVIYMMIIAKRAIIWLVHLYQNKASDEMRLQCVFEPSCSEYMILAVEKYGVIRGVHKGINRLRRCHGPNCGVDYP
ncbi:membrane protein insertion efficiency factor YidD [Lachnospiraceae bacterium HCP28S3_F9]